MTQKQLDFLHLIKQFLYETVPSLTVVFILCYVVFSEGTVGETSHWLEPKSPIPGPKQQRRPGQAKEGSPHADV